MNAWAAAAFALGMSLPYYLIPWWRRGMHTMAEVMGTGGIFPGDATKAVRPGHIAFLSFGLALFQQAAWPHPPTFIKVLAAAVGLLGSAALMIAMWHFLVPPRKHKPKEVGKGK